MLRPSSPSLNRKAHQRCVTDPGTSPLTSDSFIEKTIEWYLKSVQTPAANFVCSTRPCLTL